MHRRNFLVTCGSLAIGSFLISPVLAADIYEGLFVAARNGKMLMLDQDGKTQRTFDVADDARITRDGKPSMLQHLLSGDLLKVMTERTLGGEVAKTIDARSQR